MRWDGTDVRPLLRVAESGGRGGGGGGGITSILISPDGSQALAQASSLDLYVMSIPWLGGPAPQITIGETSTFPNRKLTDIGAQFPAWSSDGKSIHWSIGNAHVVYDLERGKAFDDSVRRANRVASDSAAGGRGGRGRANLPQYHPAETRIRLTAERDMPKGVTVLRGARAITMKGNEVIENADVVITNNRISAIGKRGSVQIPSGAHVVDVSGKTIIPGFVDTHAHLRVASNIHRDVQWSYAVNLAYGVTTARDPQTGATDVLSYEDEVRAGNILGPRIYSTGPGLFALNEPHMVAALSGERQAFERSVPGPDGTVRHNLATYTPDVMNGQVVGFIAQITDVSALKDAVRLLESEVERRRQAETHLLEVQHGLAVTLLIESASGAEISGLAQA